MVLISLVVTQPTGLRVELEGFRVTVPPWVPKDLLDALDRDGIRQRRFHHSGNWYHPLSIFPAAFCDSCGFLAFGSQEEYARSPDIVITKDVHARRGSISNSPG